MLRHNGVAFPPEYKPRGLSVRIKDKLVKLEPLQEEMLLAWAKKIGTPYVDDPVFQENFLFSLRQQWPDLFEGVGINDIDWTELHAIARSEKLSEMPEDLRKQVSAERKRVREELKARFGHATVDSHEVEIGAYLIEPPGIFMGRGAHPLRGRWKPRVFSHQVTLNLDEEAPIPEPPHGSWAGIVHDHDSMWIARWTDALSGKVKYVWLAETSHLRQEREKEKFDKAKLLGTSLEKVRRAIHKGMRDPDERRRKVATVAYLIDRLAMRVGDEKDEDEADTVGASTLRVEHVHLDDDEIRFDFLGKDSVPWEKTLRIEGKDKILAENLRAFMKDKEPGEQIFPEITSTQVNKFFQSIQPGLSAKVFRTFHATTTVRDFLHRHEVSKNGASLAAKEHTARLANLEAAIMCNHKRTVPKNYEESLQKRREAMEKLLAQKPDLAKLDQMVQARCAALEKLRAEQQKLMIEGPAQVQRKKAKLAALEAMEPPAADAARKKHQKQLKAAAKAVREAEANFKARTKRFKERIKKAEEALVKAQQARARAEKTYNERVERAKLQYELAQKTREYNLNTSLKNYIDPRVYRDWGKRVDFDWTRLYTTSLKRKFKWALEEESTSADGQK